MVYGYAEKVSKKIFWVRFRTARAQPWLSPLHLNCARFGPGLMSFSILSTRQQISSVWDLGGLTWRELIRRVWGGTRQNDLINRAYELAYNFLLALFPLLLFLIALLGVFASQGHGLRIDLFSYLQHLLPPTAYHLVAATMKEVAENDKGGKLTFGLVFALYSGSAGMTQLISTLNNAYEVPEERSWIKVHLISLGLTVAMSLLVVIALLLILIGGRLLRWMAETAGVNSFFPVLNGILQWTLALGFVVLAFAIIYYFAPDVRERHWYWITPGSVTGVLLWAVASAGLRGYLHFFNTYTRTYGSLGALIILMLWFYVTGLAVLIGGQINSTIEHAAAEHGHPEAKPVGQKAA
jgi:membrane protein